MVLEVQGVVIAKGINNGRDRTDRRAQKSERNQTMKNMKVGIGILAALVAMVSVSLAGLDMYTGKRYTTVVAPQAIGVTMKPGATNTVAAITNTPVSLVSFPGIGAMVLSVNAGGADSAAGTITATYCYTTNTGTASAWTNGAIIASASQATTNIYTWTAGAQTNQIVRFSPNSVEGRLAIVFSATGVTNGSVSAVVVTE